VTVLAEPELIPQTPAYYLPAPTAATLRRLADRLDTLTHARVSPPDVYRALARAGNDHESRLAAFEVLSSSLDAVRGYEGWLHTWTGPRSRAEVVGLVRAAAEAVS
jgi:hypothetical protein